MNDYNAARIPLAFCLTLYPRPDQSTQSMELLAIRGGAGPAGTCARPTWFDTAMCIVFWSARKRLSDVNISAWSTERRGRPRTGRQPPLNLVNKGNHGGMRAKLWTRQRCSRPVHRGQPMQGCFRSGTCILVESHNWLASAINIECKSMPQGNSTPRCYHYLS